MPSRLQKKKGTNKKYYKDHKEKLSLEVCEIVTRYEKIDHLQKLLNSRYRLTKSGYGEIVFYLLFIPTGIDINNLSSTAVPNFSPLTPL